MGLELTTLRSRVVRSTNLGQPGTPIYLLKLTQRPLNFPFQKLEKSTGRISLDHNKISQIGRNKDLKLD